MYIPNPKASVTVKEIIIDISRGCADPEDNAACSDTVRGR